MVIGQIWNNANPELRGHLRRANEERSAAFYATWRKVTALFRGFTEALRRVRLERETYRDLSRLNDRQLQDIGISRSEIGSIAQALAVAPPVAGLTVAELREIQSVDPAGRDASVVPLPRHDKRRSWVGSRVEAQPKAVILTQQGRAAG